MAIKIPRRDQLSPEEMEKFLREARAAGQLQHPNIVGIYEVGIEGDLVYIVSELIDGRPLDQWLTAKKPTPRESAQLCVEITEALDYAHQHGIIHRDLKPSNIMIDVQGQPHLMDFGLAKREAGEITMTLDGVILGTPAYMSPEQARGEGHAADRRSDIYSLGVILFELLTGEQPFRGELRMLLKQVLEDDPPPARKLKGNIPRDLETICAKCLEKDPRRRYTTVAELADDLRHYLAGEPIHARPVGKAERVWRWCKRNPAVAGLSATAVMLLVLVALAVSIGYVRTNAALAVANTARRDAEDSKQKADQHLYCTRIALAEQNRVAGELQEAEKLLNACPVQLRNWEWGYLKRLCRLDMLVLRSIFRDSNIATSIVFSPDGKRVATNSGESAKIWDVFTGKEILILTGHKDRVNCVAFSPDGKWLATGDKKARIWDTATGGEVLTLDGHIFSIESVAYSPDGKRLATGGMDGIAMIWDLVTGKEVFKLYGYTESIASVVFSPDGKWLATGNEDKTARIWDAVTGKEVFTLRGHTGGIASVAFSPDEKWLATGGVDYTTRIWDTVTGKEVFTLRGHTAGIASVAFSPDGKRLATGGADKMVKIWDVQNGLALLTLDNASNVTSVTFSLDGKWLAYTGGDGTIRILDGSTNSSPSGSSMPSTSEPASSPIKPAVSSSGTTPAPMEATTVTSDNGHLMMSVVPLSNPVLVGKNLTYEIRVSNTTSDSYRQVRVTAMMPGSMIPKLLGTIGPGPGHFIIGRQIVRFDPVPEIQPHESMIFHVSVQAESPGVFRFRVELSTDGLPHALTQEVITEVFK